MSQEKLKPNIIALSGVAVVLSIVGVIGVIISLLLDAPRGAVGSLAGLAYPLYQYVRFRRTEYMVTDENVVSNVNLGGEKHKEVGFGKIQNTSVKIPFHYQLVGNYGNISISTAGSEFNALTLQAVEDPKKVHDRIVKRIDSVESSESDQTEGYSSSYEEYRKLREASERVKNQVTGDKL